MNRVLKLQAKLEGIPFGKNIFSYIIARNAPYFTTIRPQINELRHEFIKVSMRKRRSVHNHLKTVHAIAVCNLCEFAGGVCMETSIPAHKRWIPMGMEVAYLKKAKTNLTAICDLSGTDWENCDHVDCEVSVRDTANIEVVKATIRMKVSDRKKKV